MSTLIAFYSFEGNCRDLASVMGEAVGATVKELRPVKDPVPHGMITKYLLGGKASMFKETTPLRHLGVDPRAYDLIVVGGPVWFFNITPAVRTFLTGGNWSGKRFGLFSMHRGGKGKAIATMRELVESQGGIVADTAEFIDLRRKSAEETRKRAIEWIAGMIQDGKDNHV